MAVNEEHGYSNNLAIINVLAALIKNPLLFADNNYHFNIEDFPEQFHRIVFGAVDHLAHQGLQKIGYIDINEFLKQYPTQYQIFTQNNGVAYIQNCLSVFDEKNFNYYYKTLKKFSLLRMFQSQGFDVSEIYDLKEVDPKKISEQQEAFDQMTANDIILHFETKIIQAKENFGNSDDLVQNHMGDDIIGLIDELKKTPEMGMALLSAKLTTVYRGARKGCVYMESAPSGLGKTRRAVGEACNVAIPERYDTQKKQWIRTGYAEHALLIETELELKEIQTIVLAFVSGVPETHILDGKYEEGEEERVYKAGQLILESHLYMTAITNYDMDDIINVIKKYNQIYGCDYIYYDYLSETLKIMAEGTRKTKMALRTDQVLLSMITQLKDCAKQLNIFVWTATQLSGDYKNAKELDAGFLRSAKSLSDKIDVGSILMPVRDMDQPAIDAYCAKGFETVPNFVIHVYKIRRGSYQNIKVFINFDRSTGRVTDCFVTNGKGELLPIADTNIEIMLDETKEEKFENTAFKDLDF